MQWLNNWKCWHRRLGRKIVKFKSCRRKMKRMAKQLEETQKQLQTKFLKHLLKKNRGFLKKKCFS